MTSTQLFVHIHIYISITFVGGHELDLLPYDHGKKKLYHLRIRHLVVKKTVSIPSHLVFRYISLYILIGKWWFARPLPNMTKQCTISSSPRSHDETCVSFHYILSGRMGWFNQNQLKIPFLKLRQPLKMGRVPKGNFIFQPWIFRGDGGYVSFRERQTSKFKHVKSANSRPEAYYFSKLRIPGWTFDHT